MRYCMNVAPLLATFPHHRYIRVFAAPEWLTQRVRLIRDATVAQMTFPDAFIREHRSDLVSPA